jgi:hypothetical protein
MSAKGSEDRVPKGTYDKIIKEAEEKYSLEEGSISKHTILMRLREERKTVTGGQGHVSPMIGVEVHLVDVILQLASMRQPLTATAALNLINSMVEKSKVEKEVIEWKNQNLPPCAEGQNTAYLGKSYWRNFKKRHPVLKTQRAVQFDSKREDWCTYENFEI